VLHPSPHITEDIGIQRFNPKNAVDRRLSDLSEACHAAALIEDSKTFAPLEVELGKPTAKLWGVADDELKAIQEAMAETGKSRRAAMESAHDTD
jgi:hypothetical protein